MSFSEQPPSKQWAALKYREEKFAEVWFKPEGEPFVLTFRILQENFQIPRMGKQLTIENLLRAVAIVPQEVESWRHADVSHSGMNGSNPDFKNALPPPPQHVSHLDIHVRLKPPAEAIAPTHSPEGRGNREVTPTLSPGEPEVSAAKWQDLEARWKAILGIEATVDTFRISMEGLLTQMETSLKKTLATEEKTYAPRADVAQWERAKSRVHYALPKMKDFIHRAIWALGSPERKRLGELYKDHIEPHIPFPEMDEVLKQLEELQKDRQVLSARGKTVYQECRGISADVEGALRTLQNNAATNAKNKKGDTTSKGGRFFKQVRRWSGA